MCEIVDPDESRVVIDWRIQTVTTKSAEKPL